MRGSRIFIQGGSRPDGQKTVWTTFFLLLNLFYSLLQRGSNGFITEKTVLFQGSIGVQHFPGGGGWGVQMIISIETHITCDFLGAGGPDPLPPPLDPHMVCICLGICL